MSDDVTITVRVDDRTAAGFRDVDGRLRDMRGRFASTAGDMQRSGNGLTGALMDVRASLLSLAPAAIPVAASLAPIAVQAGAAGLAVGAFGAAVIPQIANLKDAADAQQKYTDAVTKYGGQSKQALAAQQQAQQVLAGMPKATQQAAGAYLVLKDKFTQFSDSTAKFTMQPVEKSFAVLGQIVPKLTPMAEGAATQLNRLVSVAGGAVNTAGFDALSKRVSDFANSSLKRATDGAIHFGRVLSEGNAHGPMIQFMQYAREQGPAVKELLSNLASAAGNLAQGAAQAGPGLLAVVNALAKMVSAVPPEVIGRLMQMYAAFKLIKLAGAGIGAAAGGIQALATKITALRAASVAAGGGVAGLRTAFMGLSTATKATVVVAGIAAVVAVLAKLSSIGKSAPPDVDKLTSALTRLGSTGQVTGEAASKFGTHFEKLKAQMDKVLDPSIAESVNNWGHSVSGGLLKGGDATEELTGSFKAIDESLADMVKGGNAKLAAAALKDMLSHMNPEQAKKLQQSIDKYKSSLADQALEQKLTAQSMGLFGQAAQDTAAKLDSQKASADGLRGAIQALNDVNRQGLGGMIGFEAAIDAASKAAKDNAGALTMNHGVLDLNSEKSRNAASALQDLADKTDSAAASARESGASWETVNGIYERGRKSFIDSAMAMGLSRSEATQLAKSIQSIPDKKSTKLEMRTEDAVSGLDSVLSALKKTPNAKSVKVSALTDDAVSMLRDLGLKVTRLKDGRFQVTANGKPARDAIGAVQRARDGLKDKTITLSARDRASAAAHAILAAIAALRSKTVTITTVREQIAKYSTIGRPAQGQGGVSKYAEGGPINGGSGTQDDVPILAMGGEFMVNKDSARKHRRLLEAINDDRLPRFAKGGSVSKLAQAEKDARGSLRGQFGISAFGRAAGYHLAPFEKSLGAPSDLGSLVSSLNQARGEIKGATHGGTESRLLHQLDSVGKSLIRYDKGLSKVTASLDKAKSKLDDLKNSASQLSDSVKGGVLSSANITKGGAGGTVTVASIMGGLTASRDKASAFADALKGLKSKGLSKDLIQQIGEAGIEGGGLETAGALLGASSSEISSINNLQGQIASAATSAGKTTADAVYGAALKAQQKLVDSLKKQQDKLEKAMNNLAKVMEKSISKAIGKKASGGIVGAAASGGLRGGLTWVGEHEPELLELPVGSRVRSGPDSRRMAAGGGGGGSSQPIVIQLKFGQREFGQLWVDTGRHEIRTRGGIQATFQTAK
jgi:hypothetical protein